jgi:hypothetical protein
MRLGELALMLVAAATILRVLGLRHTQRLLARLRPKRAKTTRNAPRTDIDGTLVDFDIDADLGVQRLAIDIARAARWVRARCLTRALLLQTLLARRGEEAELRIGVRRDGPRHRAHAWVEWHGRPLGEADDVAERFLPLQHHEAKAYSIDASG